MRTRFAIVSAILLALLLAATPVAADCDPVGTPAEVLPTAAVAFVGTVVEIDGSLARFDVLEDWTGSVDDAVQVFGLTRMGAHGGSTVVEDDREWRLGATYLVIPFVDGAFLRDHICTATTEWTDDLAALRPPGVEAAMGAGAESTEAPPGPPPLPVVLVGIAAVAVAGISVLAFRRRS